MFYDLKMGLYFLKKNIKQFLPIILAWGFVTLFSLLMSFSVLKRLSIGSLGELCVGDYIDSLNRGYLIDFFVVPLTAAIIFIISEHDCTSNCILKFHTRTNILRNQYIKILILSIAFSLGLIFLSYIIAGLLTFILMNWNDQTSYFYQAHGYILEIGFASVQMLTAYKMFIKLFFFLTVMVLVNLRLKKVFSFLIMVILSAVRLFDFFQFEIEKIFNLVKEKSYFPVSLKIIYLGIVPILTIALMSITFKMMKRKDFIST